MAVDLQTVIDMKDAHFDDYQEQHFKFRRLRDLWHGRFWLMADEDSQARNIKSIFRDLGHTNSIQLPPIKIVRNTLQAICVKYQTFLSPVPMVNYYVDAPETDERRHEMTLKERYTYGVWRAGQMSAIFRDIAWYQPLMGDVFVGAYPDVARKIPVPILRSPETAYPIRGFGTAAPSAHVFHWQERNSTLMRTFPDYVARGDLGNTQSSSRAGRRRDRGVDPLVDVYEYSDENEFSRWAGGVKVAGIEHGFGFDIFQHTKFITIPGEVFGHGAVEQMVGLNEADNMIGSLMFQAIYENIFPTIVLTDPSKAPEEMMKGPGSVITLNPGGKYQSEAPAVEAIATQLGYRASLKQDMQEQGGMPAVNFGTSPASSIVTGAAINELQGAGTGSTVEMVQGSLGTAMSRWNEMAIKMQQEMWPGDAISLNYMSPVTKMDATPTRGTVKLKGSELVGGTANEIVFAPAMDQHDKLVMWLQAKGGGLVSDQFIQKQIGIPDPEAMQDEIFQEEVNRAVLAFMVQQLTTPEQAHDVAAQGVAFIEGGTVKRAGPPPGMPPAGAAPGAPPGAPSGGPNPALGGTQAMQAGGQGVVQAPALNLPPGAPVPAGSAAAQGVGPQATPTAATVNAVVRALAGGSYTGRVWLVGEIAVKGTTSGNVEVAVTDPADRQVVSSQAPQFQFTFHVVKGEPQEQSVEITSAGGSS